MEGYITKDYGQPVKRYVQTMELKDNPELIRKYKEAHSEEKAWREILDGIRQVGILEMEIYIAGPRLVMICDTPLAASRSGKNTWQPSSNATQKPRATRNGR